MEANAAAGANAAMIAAGALLGTSKGGAFLSHRLATDPHTGTERNLLELVWFGVGGAQRRELTRGGASSSSSSKASSSLLTNGLAKGDTIGVCLDYAAPTRNLFFTHNGTRIEGSDIDVSISAGWRPAIAATGPCCVRVNFGVDVAPNGERTPTYEARIQREEGSGYLVRLLRNTDPPPPPQSCPGVGERRPFSLMS